MLIFKFTGERQRTPWQSFTSRGLWLRAMFQAEELNHMKIGFDTTIVGEEDQEVTKLYSDGEYKSAMARLFEVLDTEPNNWQARLFLSRVIDSLGLGRDSSRQAPGLG